MAYVKFSLGGDVSKAQKLEQEMPSVVQLILGDVADIIQNSAKQNAPYLTGNLRSSITTQREGIKQGFVVVGSPVAYARRREFENRKNPHTRYYLQRGYTENASEIDRIIQEDLSKELS